jgi:hypothetical protein
MSTLTCDGQPFLLALSGASSVAYRIGLQVRSGSLWVGLVRVQVSILMQRLLQ